MRPTRLDEATWPDCGPVAATSPIADPASAPLLLVPTGSLEQHGPHLPLGVDTLVATAVAGRLADRLAGPVLVGPPITYGASGEHEGFPGTVSIGADALASLLLELGRSACRWAGRLVFVNGHGGNAMSLVQAVTRLRYEGRAVGWVPCAAGGDAHAGHTETSLMLALAPDQVRLDLARPGNTAPINGLIEELRRGGVAEVSANGVLGDPTGADAATGERLLERMVRRAASAIEAFEVGSDGRLRAPAAVAR